ncbi:MAG: acetylxylan esterase [Anaerolineae bacterium]
MPFFDFSLSELQRYQPAIPEPPDFDAFWAKTLEAAHQHPLDARFTPVDAGMRTVETYDVEFSGYGGQRVKGWLLLPAGANGPLPGVLEFIGYGGGRGWPINWLTWASAGYAFMVMDTRGQGSAWQRGDTPDIPDGANPSYPGFMTQGVLDPHTYYYRRVFTDAVRAFEAFSQHPKVDASRIAVTGGSQGGAITLAAAGLIPTLKVAMPDVPFLCHFQRAIETAPDAPYTEIVSYLRVHREKAETVFKTLNYFDGVHFARRIRAQVLCSTALMDTICPPSTVFAAYNAITTEKEMKVYPYNDHAGGGIDHMIEKIAYLRRVMPLE